MIVLAKMIEKYYNGNEAYVAIFSILIFYFFKTIWQNNSSIKILPATKLAFYNIAGHPIYIPQSGHHLKKYDYSTYLLQTIMAFREIHVKKSMFVGWIFNEPVVCLNKAVAFEDVLNNPNALNKAFFYKTMTPMLKNGLGSSERDLWKVRRKLLAPGFHFRILKDYLPIINKHSRILIQMIEKTLDKEWINIFDVAGLCSVDILCETMFGYPTNFQREKHSNYVTSMHRTTSAASKRLCNIFHWIETLYFKTKAGTEYLKDREIVWNFTKSVIKEKKALYEKNDYEYTENSNGKDSSKDKTVLDILIDHHMTHKEFTEEHVQEELDTIAFGGFDTITLCLCWTFYLLGLNPEIQRKVQEEVDSIMTEDNFEITAVELCHLKYLERVLKESLRLYTPAPLIGRKLSEDITVDGHCIPKGTNMALILYGLHRDPDVFPNPEVFDPDRFLPENAKGRHPYAFLPFSAGPRNCIGQKFGMMELKIVVATVMKHYNVHSLDARDQVLPSLMITLQPSRPVRVKFTPRYN